MREKGSEDRKRSQEKETPQIVRGGVSYINASPEQDP